MAHGVNRVLMIGRRIHRPERIGTFSEMWLYHLEQAFEALGVEVLFCDRWQGEPVERYVEKVLATAVACDHILAPGVRYWTEVDPTIPRLLAERFPGCVAQIHDGPLLRPPPGILTLALKDCDGEPDNATIGWAADPAMFYPQPKSFHDPLRVFIDHAAFDVSGVDHSLTAVLNLKHLNVPFVARTLTDDGIEIVDPNDFSVRPYNRTPVPAPELAAELRRTDIFIVTHPESLGQTVLEAAMCGALILAPRNCIPGCRLDKVNHQLFGSRIDWGAALDGLDRTANAERVRHWTWPSAATLALQAMASWKKPQITEGECSRSRSS